MRGALAKWTPVASGAVALVALVEAAVAGPHDALITKHASTNGVPESLVRRVIHIESKGNPRAVNDGNYGLMQIRLGTARALGYIGEPEGLLDPDTNMTYAVKYLAFAYRAAGCTESGAIANYQRGFYGKPLSNCGPQPRPATVLVAAEEPPQVMWPKVVQVLTFARPQSFNVQIPQDEVVSAPGYGEPARSRPAQSGALQLAAAPADARSSEVPRSPRLPARRPEAAAAQTVAKAHASDDAWPPLLSAPQPAVVMLPMPMPRPEEAPKVVALAAAGSDQSPTEASARSFASSPVSPDVQPAKLDPVAVPLPHPRPVIRTEIAGAPKRDAKPARRTAQQVVRSEPEKEQPSGLMAMIQKLKLPTPGPARSDPSRDEQPAFLSLFQKLSPSTAAEPLSPRR